MEVSRSLMTVCCCIDTISQVTERHEIMMDTIGFMDELMVRCR